MRDKFDRSDYFALISELYSDHIDYLEKALLVSGGAPDLVSIEARILSFQILFTSINQELAELNQKPFKFIKFQTQMSYC